jgi:hypothetical protein
MSLDSKQHISPFTLRSQLNAYVLQPDPDGFVGMCKAIKARALELMHSDRYLDAGNLISAYDRAFEGVSHLPPDFLFAIIEVFPRNSINTLKLLGTSKEIDQAIINTKVDIPSLSGQKDCGFTYLLGWAVKNNDWPLIDQVVLQLAVVGLRMSCHMELANQIIDTLLSDSENTRPFSPAVDNAIASLISVKGYSTRQPDYVEMMANKGLHESLIKLLVHNHMFECPLAQYSEERAAIILAALPPSPTLEQLRAIHYFLKPNGLSEQILFDDSVDLDGYLDLMRKTHYLGADHGDLSFPGILPFRVCMTPDNINIPARRNQIAKLLNITYEESISKGHFTGEDPYTKIMETGIPKHAIRLIDSLKGQALEDALGL